MKRFSSSLLGSLWLPVFLSVCFPVLAKTKVACIGNSITYGLRVADREQNCYPARLSGLLGNDYEVGNFGFSGATLLRRGHRPYILTQEWQDAKAFAPDIAVIHLGTNDTDPRNWPNYSDEFAADYLDLIDTLRSINPKVRVIVANMAPIGAAHKRFKTGTRAWRDSIRLEISRVARLADAELIDFASPLRDFPNLMPDAVHPNAEGAKKLAEYVYSAISGKYGGLHLPEVWQSGMVVPRNRKFKIPGSADAFADISVKIGNNSLSTRADALGRWEVEAGPFNSGEKISIAVSDGRDSILLSDIVAGVVWLASGQSNMAFTLAESKDAPADYASDSRIRFFDMLPSAYTDNIEWSEEQKNDITALRHYRPTSWKAAGKRTSAVAYNFARTLADSLQKREGNPVAVGIISNAVGGAGTESWIDIETLEHIAPDALVDWLHNDWLQPWVQGRAVKNMGSDKKGTRHPYEPGYLFAAGIRPLEAFPVDGVIWYQGESNAHNPELHELYFEALLQSWRREFGDDRLPFIFAQLSSINRPSWPVFRESQRRLSLHFPDVRMVVTSDLGHPSDVHPKRKAPVGRRMALQALNFVYGLADIESSGPTPLKAISRRDGSLFIEMSHSEGLRSSDSEALRTFEVAGADGFFRPAEASIVDRGVSLRSEMVERPVAARYAWQPFTDANLINADSLPASTFKISVDMIDNGIEYGVSGAFVGKLPSGEIIWAGGCNFPFEDPISVPASTKTFYQGIYSLESGRRIGMLPAPTAYGASASTSEGIAMLGGQGLRSCYLFDGTNLTSLPDLPESVDNGFAAAIDDTLWLLGQGKLYKLRPGAEQWIAIDVPGAPRTQPVMASSDGKLFIWGGFTPGSEGKTPEVHTAGLCFDPATEKWHRLPAPKVNGKELTLSGGTATSAPDGTIFAAGGVNRQIFLDALTCQAPDYLEHPAEWYHFNPYLLRFDPKKEKWNVVAETPQFARAGGNLILDGNTLIMIGGELKPRVRARSAAKYEILH